MSSMSTKYSFGSMHVAANKVSAFELDRTHTQFECIFVCCDQCDALERDAFNIPICFKM